MQVPDVWYPREQAAVFFQDGLQELGDESSVAYRGQISEKGIMGEWSVSLLSGQFHVWPKSLTVFDELYLSEDLKMAPQTPLPGVHPRGKPEFDLTSFD